jgi:hypothetical protein
VSYAILIVAHVALFPAATRRQLRGITTRVVPFAWRTASLLLRAVGLDRRRHRTL